MKKKIILFLLLIITFFVGLEEIKVKAAVASFDQEKDDKYLTLCKYEVVNSFSSKEFPHTDYIGVFYNMDKDKYEFTIQEYVPYGGPTNRNPYYSQPFNVAKASNEVYDGKKGVYFQNSMSPGEFRCPKNGYIDYSDYAYNEMCFDDDGQWCANYANDWTTKFGKTSEKFVSQKLVYNIEDHVKTYILGNDVNPDGLMFSDISCDDVNSGKFNLKTDLKDKIIGDFSKNFLKSRPVPLFIKNFDAYKKLNTINSADGKLDSDINIKFENFKKKCIAEINEKLNNGELTDDEATRAINNYDISNSDLSNQFNAATTEIESGSGDFKIPDISIRDNTLNCKELVGENLSKIIKLIITILQIAGAIIAIVNGMITLIPAVVSKDAEALKGAEKKCITMAIVLVLIILLPTLLMFLSKMFGYDLSCIF